MPEPDSSCFAALLISWQKSLGRHDLPWQNTRDPYAIWVSEIMLQQTRVAAAIPYYLRFMARFPDVADLARADEDEVLRHWSGLGYYSRARNLRAAAQVLMERHDSRFPSEIKDILALPGIGRSTAAAIAAFAFGQRQAILDGNVKRVLARCFGIEGWPGQPSVEKTLWKIAENLLPDRGIEAYTQGLMDLGASICSRSKPACGECPMQAICIARREHRTAELPAARPRKAIPHKHTRMLILHNGNEILLEKRSPSGIWGGMWSLPETDIDADARLIVRERFRMEAEMLPALPSISLSFTHFRLSITPQPMRVCKRPPSVQAPGTLWLNREDALGAALPSPVRKLLQSLKKPS